MTDRDIIIKDELPVLEPNTIEKIQIKQLMNLKGKECMTVIGIKI